MSSVALSGNAAGAGVFTIASPNSASSYTATLPTATTTLVGTDATQTLTNKTIQGGAITSGTAVASTSGTSIDFTSIPSWAKRITVMFNGVSLSGTTFYLVQIGSGSVTTTGYISCSQASVGANNTSFTTSTSGFVIKNAALASANQYGSMLITLVSGNIYINSHTFSDSVNSAVTNGGGGVTLSGTLDRVRITTVNGTDTFDAGSVNILYE